MANLCETRSSLLRQADIRASDTRTRDARAASSRPMTAQANPAHEAGEAVHPQAVLAGIAAALILSGLLGTVAITGLIPSAHDDAIVPTGAAPYAGLVNPQAVLQETRPPCIADQSGSAVSDADHSCRSNP